jgi:hypothetical protein
MPGTTHSIVKIVKDKHEILNTLPQCLDIHASFIFIELTNSSSSDNLTLDGTSMKSLITNFNVLPCNYHNLPTLQVIFNMLSLASMLWRY